ncbi:hypothetical protein [Tissierella pigra]|uniref:Uncharacterized protein n=1 Tax=Tissierella pigra TaxID=2607614 RepID=A0A6N7XIP1_9FIRM|nr:hypothetical protein [Tissierella pigra]MSU00622.1 hypothetical protein [Tissierella pigra]
MRDGEPEVEEATVGGNKVAVKNNAVEIKFEEETESIPKVVVNFKENVKVTVITDKTGKKYDKPAQLEEAKNWLGYKGNLDEFKKVIEIGTDRTFAEVIAKLGESFQVTVVNEAGKDLTLTINLKLEVPAPVLVKDLLLEDEAKNFFEPMSGVFAIQLFKNEVKAKFPKITDADKLELQIGEDYFELNHKVDVDENEFWSSGSLQSDSDDVEITKDMIKNGVIRIKK